MDGWLEPMGPEPARTYWVRRAVVVLAILLVIAVVWAVIAALLPKPNTSKPAANSSTHAAATQAARPGSAATAPAAAASSNAPAASSTAPSAAPSSATPTGPTACDTGKVTLAITGNANVKSGDTTTLKFVLTNNTGTDCILDVSPNTTVVRITSGSDRIWSTEDCDQWLGQEKKETVGAGKTLEWSMDWNTKRSAAGCKLTGDYLQPGTYVVRASYANSVNGSLVLYLHG